MHTPLLSIRISIEESRGFVKGNVVLTQQNDFPSKKTSEKKFRTKNPPKKILKSI